MNRTIWRLALSTAILFLGAAARGAEVTVVGSTWENRNKPVCNNSDSLFDRPDGDLDLLTEPSSNQGSVLDSITEPSSKNNSAEFEKPSETRADGEVCDDVVLDCFMWWANRPLESSAYVRFDYLAWDEYIGSQHAVSETGTLYTFGYTRNSGAQRIRVEFSTGEAKYKGSTTDGYQVIASTAYRGVRCEYEWLYDLNRSCLQPATVFVGLGSRFWIRNIRDCYITEIGEYATGFQETWVTLYPYLGFEKAWTASSLDQYFISTRIGSTGWTYEHRSIIGSPGLNPTAGLIGQVEGGFRSEQFFATVYFDVMTWHKSSVVEGYYQPRSQMLTLGLKLGLAF